MVVVVLDVVVEETLAGDRLAEEVLPVRGPPKLDQVEESVSSRLEEGRGAGKWEWSAGEWSAQGRCEAAVPPRSP